MLLVPKKLTIEFELFANSETNALTVVVYFALLDYAKAYNSQQISIITARKLAREVVFLLSGAPVDVQHSIQRLVNDGLLIDDNNGNYVFAEEVR
jgi:hypothetical protein